MKSASVAQKREEREEDAEEEDGQTVCGCNDEWIYTNGDRQVINERRDHTRRRYYPAMAAGHFDRWQEWILMPMVCRCCCCLLPKKNEQDEKTEERGGKRQKKKRREKRRTNSKRAHKFHAQWLHA